MCEILEMGCVVFHKTVHTGHMGYTREYHPAACKGRQVARQWRREMEARGV
jgi:hypothetical protein